MRSRLNYLRDVVSRVVMHRRFVPGCLCLAAAMRMVWILAVPNEQVLDFRWYDLFARNIAHGDGYSVNGIPTGYWPIGYPGLLGGLYFLVGTSVFAGKVLNVILYMGAIVLMYRISQALFGSEFEARVTMGLLCFYPNHIAYAALLSSEILFVFLIALAAYLFIKARASTGLLALSGIAWGLAALTKPHALLLPFVFVLLFSKNAQSFVRTIVLLYCVMLLTVTPWLIRNYHVFGVFTLAHTGGINLLDGNNPYATGYGNFDEHTNELLGDLKTVPLQNIFDGKEVARDARAAQIGMEYIVHNPGRVLALWPTKFWHLYKSDIDGFYWSLGVGMMRPPMFIQPGPFIFEMDDRMKVMYESLRGISQMHYLVMIALFLLSLPILMKMALGPQHIGLAIIALLTLVYLVLFGAPRYHFPMMPWVAIYAGLGAQVLMRGNCSLKLLEKN